jgi:hypothetical protein
MTPVSCNECGADLDVGPTTNFVTCARCGARLAVRRTGNSIFTERAPGDLHVTDDPIPPRRRFEAPEAGEADVVWARLSHLEREARVARIDREWQVEREKYLVTGRHGRRQVPTTAGSAIGGIFMVGFGIVWTIFAFSLTSNSPFGGGMLFPVFGVLFILLGAGWSIYAFNKAQEYERAHAEYRRRRQAAERDEGG